MKRLIPFLFLALTACAHRPHFEIPRRDPDRMVSMEVTAYSSDRQSTNWKRSWWRLGQPVIASGPRKGRPKKVGITASGTRARPGTVAADTRLYPMGTVVYVPDYGWGRVEDRGGAIKGQKLDLYFTTRRKALQWGRVHKTVQIWFPR